MHRRFPFPHSLGIEVMEESKATMHRRTPKATL
jgi:hypothetical protein